MANLIKIFNKYTQIYTAHDLRFVDEMKKVAHPCLRLFLEIKYTSALQI